jgi:tRNA guanosine-2'-O-methyltransferase
LIRLLDAIQPSGRNSVVLGSAEYCLKSRGWQALCVLSHFMSSEMASLVCERTFQALEEPLHGQIRYFIEIFTIKCARRFPGLYAGFLVRHLSRRDLSLQMVTSLMVVTGNLIVGRFQADFIPFVRSNGTAELKNILAGVIPWLSSTQGFSRAIAQLLVHKLIPAVIDVDNGSSASRSDWYLLSIFMFLEENSEMKRLRKKQSKFFESYEVDMVCTVQGVLSVPVDEGGEAHPVHMVEAIKECLKEVYDEAHTSNTPSWKQVECISREVGNYLSLSLQEDQELNFQRKIIPIDALNLELEGMQERRLRNATGRMKQRVIVCASLIDKVPNLAGLARTAEIFSSERLVIPDKMVTRMDNFKSISVGAGDWIEVEECKVKVCSYCQEPVVLSFNAS